MSQFVEPEPKWFADLPEADRAEILTMTGGSTTWSTLAGAWAAIRHERALRGPPVPREAISAAGVRVDIFPIPSKPAPIPRPTTSDGRAWDAWGAAVCEAYRTHVFTLDQIKALWDYAYGVGSEHGAGGGSLAEWLEGL